MSDFFQSLRHRQSTYNRPNLRWQCGGDCEGCPCYLGPDTNGKCQAGAVFDGRVSGQCLPRRTGSRWLCTRPDVHGGDACERGPRPDGSCCMTVPPCRPRRSLRSKRGLATLWLCLATLVWLALVAIRGDDGGKAVLAPDPGPLSANHSFLEGRCASCHAGESMDALTISGLHATANHHRAIDDGQLCLDCHRTIGGDGGTHAFSPHTVAALPAAAAGSGKSARAMMLAASALAGSHLEDGGIGCATCHQEHHDATADIATLSNRQCQICHENQFAGFAGGHPEFADTGYPYARRTAIRFDHFSHYQRHFGEELESGSTAVPAGFDPAAEHAESASCAACHTPEKSGGGMAVKSFEVSCAGCHESDTRAGDSLAFLAFPPLNRGALDEELAKSDPPRSLGAWIEEPADRFPWPTLHLLDPAARAAWSRLREAGTDPFDAAAPMPDDPAAVADIELIAWAVKELAADLSRNQPHENPSNAVGQDELVRRLQAGGFSRAAPMLRGLPPGGFNSMARGGSKDAYDRLAHEVAKRREDGSLPEPVAPQPEEASTGTASPPVADGNETFGDGEETFGDAEEPAQGKEETFGDAEETFGDAEETFGDAEETFGDAEETFGDAEETFGDAEETFGDAEETFGDAKETFGDAEETFGGGDESLGGDGADATEEAKPVPLDPIRPETWATKGGWYEQYGALYYRSTGHADPLIKQWLDELAARVPDPLALAHLKDGFDFRSGADSKASGSCLKCHAIDEARDEHGRLAGASIHWGDHARDESRPTLTRYDHVTHLLFADCRACHQTLAGPDSGGFLASFPKAIDWNAGADWTDKGDPAKFRSNFAPIPKQTCADCHTASKAGDSCIQCHLYHPSNHPTELSTSTRTPAE